MADVNKVKGNINQPEPDKAREKNEPDVEELREKWAKVGKVDPDEKKERKPKAQEESETRQKQTTGKKPKLGAPEPSIFEPKAPAPAQGAQGAEAPPPPAKTPQAAKTSTPEEPQEGEKTTPSHKPAHKKKTIEKKKAKTMGKEALTPTTQTKPAQESHKTKEPEKKDKSAEVIAPEPLPPPPLAQGAWEATGKETDTEKKKDKEVPTAKLPTQIQQAPQDMPQSPAISDTTTTPAPPPLETPFAKLPPQVQQLFEKMVGVMTVMNTTGVQETTISLNNPQFEKSIFYGAEIVVTEFSSAPKAFNIELRGSENAINLFAENSQRILDEIQKNDYNFTVTRIDTSYLPKSEEEKRKESRPVKRKRST